MWKSKEIFKDCCDKAFADHKAVKKSTDRFVRVIADEDLASEQICDADEALLF